MFSVNPTTRLAASLFEAFGSKTDRAGMAINQILCRKFKEKMDER